MALPLHMEMTGAAEGRSPRAAIAKRRNAADDATYTDPRGRSFYLGVDYKFF